MDPGAQSTMSHSARERIKRIAALYQKHLEEHPLLTKAITRLNTFTYMPCLYPVLVFRLLSESSLVPRPAPDR